MQMTVSSIFKETNNKYNFNKQILTTLFNKTTCYLNMLKCNKILNIMKRRLSENLSVTKTQNTSRI